MKNRSGAGLGPERTVTLVTTPVPATKPDRGSVLNVTPLTPTWYQLQFGWPLSTKKYGD